MESEPDLSPNLAEAERFLQLLDPEAEHFTFQGFDDKKQGRKDLVFVRHGPLAAHGAFMAQANQRGGYVGVMVQEGDGITRQNEKSCRTKASVQRIRAVFQEDDGEGRELPLEPHIIVESSPGKHHRYVLVEDLGRDDFAAVMKVMVEKYGSDDNAKDLARVLRLPGFWNQKSDYPEPFQVRIVHESGAQPYNRDQILEAFKPEPAAPHKAPPEPKAGESVSVDQAMLARAKRIALDAACRTLDDPKTGRHGEIYKMGQYIRRDLFRRNQQPDSCAESAILDAALMTFNDHMRPTNTSGQTVGMDWSAEQKTIREGFRNHNGEADRHGTRKGDFDDTQPEPDHEPATEAVDFPEPFPGFMADVVTRALQTAVMPQPRLTTLAVLVGMASSICGHYRLPCGMRLNLYGVGTADTGTGKDHPQKVAKAIVKASGQRVIGKPGSGQGLEDALEDYAAMLATIDEIAHLFEAINGTNKMPYLIELASVLLQLFSASSSTYFTRVLAKVKGHTACRGVEHPCVSLLGFATPQKLGESLTVANLEDGLAGRLLFASGLPDSEVEPRRVMKQFELGDLHDDAAAVGAFKQFEFQKPNHVSGGLTRGLVEIDPDADAQLNRMMIDFHRSKLEPNVTAYARALLARSYEKASRVAGVLAVFDKPDSPVMTKAHVLWAERLVKASNAGVIGFVTEHMHGNKIQVDAAKVKETILKIKQGKVKPPRPGWKPYLKSGLVVRSWALKSSHLDKYSFDQAVDHLVALDEVIPIKAEGNTPAMLNIEGAS